MKTAAAALAAVLMIAACGGLAPQPSDPCHDIDPTVIEFDGRPITVTCLCRMDVDENGNQEWGYGCPRP